jgi:chloride channel protein, CIC family
MLSTFLGLRLRLLRLLRLSDMHTMLLWAALAGVSGALVTTAFRDSIGIVERLLTGREGSLVGIARGLSWPARLLLPAAGGAVAGLFLLAVQRFSKGAASDYMEAIAIGDGHLPVRQNLLRSISSLASIASGGSIGREGSMVQLSALAASTLGRVLHFDTARLRLLVACGAAAGITSAYNTPLAGALFVTEIVLGTMVMDHFGPLVVASVFANVTMRAFPGYHPTYEMPLFPDISGLEVLLFVLMGLVAGLIAPYYLHLLDTARKRFRQTGLPLPARLALGGLLVGAISVWVPEVWGNGYSVVNSLLHQPWVWSAVLLVLVAKIAATALTTGSGAVGGVFTPTLFVGAALGWLFGAAMHGIVPHVVSAPFAYAVVGMGAFLAAATGAPLMAILMIFEMTLSYQVVLPLMLACVLAHLMARSLDERAMYEVTSRRNREEKERLRLRGMRMGDFVKPAETVLPLTASVEQMTRMFAAYPVKYIYIVDDAQRYQGVVALQDLAPVLSDRGGASTGCAADFLRREQLHVLTPGMSLGEALQHFMQHMGERLPVVQSAAEPMLLGVVYKSTVLDACFQLSR